MELLPISRSRCRHSAAHKFYEKPTTERKRKKAAAVSRQRKLVRSSQVPKKMY